MAFRSITEVAQAGDAKALIRDWRVKSLVWPYFFIKTVLGNPDIIPRIHGADIERVIRNALAGHRKQFIEWPRRHMKTSTFTCGLSMWFVLPSDDNDKDYAINQLGIKPERWAALAALRNPNYSQLICFETMANAQKKVGELRWHFESNDLFRSLFPEISYRGTESPWNNDGFRIRRTGTAAKIAEGTFDAAGVGVALQSRHYDLIWLDDVVGESAAKSETEMDSTLSWVGRLTGCEKLGATTKWFGVSNRWGFNDLNSVLRNDPSWHFFTRRAWDVGEDGERIPNFPEKYPLEVLDEVQHHFIYVSREGTETDFLAQWQNDPRPGGQALLDHGRIHQYEVTPGGGISCSCGRKYHPENLNRYLLFDPYNAKGKTASKSMPALAVVGLSTDKHVFLLDIFQKRVRHNDLVEKIFELNDRWQGVVAMGYEDVGAQNMWETLLRREMRSSDWLNHRPRHRELRRVKGVGVSNKPLETRVREFLVPYLDARPGVGFFAARKSQQLFWDMLELFPHPIPGHDYDLLSALAMGAHPDFGWQFPYGEEERERDENLEQEYLEHFNAPYSVNAHA